MGRNTTGGGDIQELLRTKKHGNGGARNIRLGTLFATGVTEHKCWTCGRRKWSTVKTSTYTSIAGDPCYVAEHYLTFLAREWLGRRRGWQFN